MCATWRNMYNTLHTYLLLTWDAEERRRFVFLINLRSSLSPQPVIHYMNMKQIVQHGESLSRQCMEAEQLIVSKSVTIFRNIERMNSMRNHGVNKLLLRHSESIESWLGVKQWLSTLACGWRAAAQHCIDAARQLHGIFTLNCHVFTPKVNWIDPECLHRNCRTSWFLTEKQRQFTIH